MFMPGAIDGAGFIVGFAGLGAGVAFFAGAGVAVGIPGMGAIVGSAATPGETVTTRMKAATLKRVRSKGTSSGNGSVLRIVVRYLSNAGFRPSVSRTG
jgi:hypothetical protein